MDAVQHRSSLEKKESLKAQTYSDVHYEYILSIILHKHAVINMDTDII